MIKIDKGVPIPPPAPPGAAVGDRHKYPWSGMEVGDSFFAPWADFSQIGASVSRRSRATGQLFVTRRLVEKDVSGIRVWRTA